MALLDLYAWMRRPRYKAVAGGLVSTIVAAVLFSRVGIDGFLYRDEAIYAYGGQQMMHGVAPYASIFDPKGPAATIVCGAAAALAHLLGFDDLTVMRVAFYACAVLTALAVYLLALQLWHSVIAAVVAATVFASFRGYAQDALRGPDAHTIGPLFAVVCMWLTVRRNWFWAAFAGSLATLVKQTYLPYPILVVVLAVMGSPGRRGRALAASALGALAPIALVSLYFVVEHSFDNFVVSAIVFPVIGLHRAVPHTIPQRWGIIASTVSNQYQFSGILFFLGLVLLAAIGIGIVIRRRTRTTVVQPVAVIVGITLLAQAVYVSLDYLSYDDLYQMLPYGALGFAAAAALVLRRRRTSPRARSLLIGGTTAALAALVVLSCIWFTRDPFNDHALPEQRATGCALDRIVPRNTQLYALGDAVPLVLTHRRNPDPYIYLESGVTGWKIDHTPGGFAGWVSQVTDPRVSTIIVQGWAGKRVEPMEAAIRRAGYRPGWVGEWYGFFDHAALANARAEHMRVTIWPSPWPETSSGASFREQRCGSG